MECLHSVEQAGSYECHGQVNQCFRVGGPSLTADIFDQIEGFAGLEDGPPDLARKRHPPVEGYPEVLDFIASNERLPSDSEGQFPFLGDMII